MRKTVLYLAILALLGCCIYYFIFRKENDAFSPDEAGFTVTDTAAVGKLFLASNSGETILAERTDSGWMINKQYKALPSMLQLVMGTLRQQHALYPVTQSAYENVIKNLSTNGIKVEVYGRDGKKMKVFYVGGTAVNNIGTNMMMDGAKRPFVVTVDGFNGYLTPRFSTKVRDWRDRTVFNITPEEIKTISVVYADKPQKSFVLTQENGTITIKGDPAVTTAFGGLNTRRATLFLDFFKNINCEGYLNGLDGMDTTIATAPKQSAIEITGQHGQHQRAEIYWVAINKRSKNQQTANPDVPDDYDADRLYAVINEGKDTVMIQYLSFEKMFRSAFEFYQKDANTAPAPQENNVPKNVMMRKTGA